MAFVIAIVAGAATGLLTGAGIGGGTLLVLYLTALAGVEQVTAQGVNLLYFLVTAPAALYQHLKNKLVEVRLGTVAALSGSACALVTALLARNLDSDILRKVFGGLFIAVGIKELLCKKKKEEQKKA